MCKENCLLSNVEYIRDLAWEACNKYRFDPALGRAHEKYLEMLNEIIRDELVKQRSA